MKRTDQFMARPPLSGTALVVLVIVLLLPPVGHVLAGEPAVYLPETVFEFAPVVEGVTIEHDFILANRGEAPLAILALKSG